MEHTKKVLIVTMPDSSWWEIPAHIIIDSMARYNAEEDVREGDAEEFDDAYANHYAYAEEVPDEMIDWATYDMNWSDMKSHAQCIKDPAPQDYDDAWCDADKWVSSTSMQKDEKETPK